MPDASHPSSDHSPVIVCDRVSVSRGAVDILASFDLSVRRGEVIALMGPSGSGKSTLLNVLCGLLTPSSGTVEVLGRHFSSLSDRERSKVRLSKFGVVFQGSDLIPELSVVENVELPLRLLGHSRRAAETRALEVLAKLDVDQLANRPLSAISGGQRQRVAVARALSHAPEILLADEPTGALDDANAARAVALMVAQIRSTHSAAVVVTHDPDVATQCDRVLHLGRIAALDGSDAS